MYRKLAAGVLCSALAFAAAPGVAVSLHSGTDFPLTADPDAPQWKSAPSVFAGQDSHGKPVAGHRTEIRSRWTGKNLYLLFVCPYEELYLKPNPTSTAETNRLWNWDVAELFIGDDFQNIQRYKEFEISPQGEWVDLDIDRKHPLPEGGWLWNSAFQSKARIDRNAKIWYGEMQIPWSSISSNPPKAGQEFRVNFYRMQGPPPDRKKIAWQPTNSDSFHVPEAFSILRLEAPKGN
jgi:hypothetical protein